MATIWKNAVQDIQKIINEANGESYTRFHNYESTARSELTKIKSKWWYKFCTWVEFKVTHWSLRIERSWKNAFKTRDY